VIVLLFHVFLNPQGLPLAIIVFFTYFVPGKEGFTSFDLVITRSGVHYDLGCFQKGNKKNFLVWGTNLTANYLRFTGNLRPTLVLSASRLP
jgi:hypothetical protein